MPFVRGSDSQAECDGVILKGANRVGLGVGKSAGKEKGKGRKGRNEGSAERRKGKES